MPALGLAVVAVFRLLSRMVRQRGITVSVSNKRDVVAGRVPADRSPAPLHRVSRHLLSLSVIALLAAAGTAGAQTNTVLISDLMMFVL